MDPLTSERTIAVAIIIPEKMYITANTLKEKCFQHMSSTEGISMTFIKRKHFLTLVAGNMHLHTKSYGTNITLTSSLTY